MTRTASSVIDSLLTIDSPYDDDTLARIAWATIAAPGDRYATSLVDALGPIDALETTFGPEEASVADLAACRFRKQVGGGLPYAAIATAIESTLTAGLSVVTPASSLWPGGLADLAPVAPFALWVRGETVALGRPGIVIVGSEHMSAHGLHTCLDFVSQWAALGYAIYSTSEHGIATAAILAALAVDGTPIVMTAAAQEAAASRIAHRVTSAGAFVAELPPGAHHGWERTSRRNWLLVAASTTTVVIDAALASPSIDFADAARSLGRGTGVIVDRYSTRSDPAIAYLLDEVGSSQVVHTSDINLL